MTETDLAYIAGFIDGEGCIGLSPRNKQRTRCYPYLRVANTDKKILERRKRTMAKKKPRPKGVKVPKPPKGKSYPGGKGV